MLSVILAVLSASSGQCMPEDGEADTKDKNLQQEPELVEIRKKKCTELGREDERKNVDVFTIVDQFAHELILSYVLPIHDLNSPERILDAITSLVKLRVITKTFNQILSDEWIGATLKEARAAIDAENSFRQTALTIAIAKRSPSRVKILLQAGADVNKADTDGYTPLLTASSDGCKEIVEMLIRAGADPNKVSNYGNTPLLVASSLVLSSNEQEGIVKILLRAGADPNIADNHGYTPLLTASHYGHEAIVEMLLGAGADVNKADENGYTPLFVHLVVGMEKL